ncbi:hypothetical protein GGR51DRAFT_527163 [Nemania sp. FL0031]|nr:hypothetical protein GGR51DRAFT_527163 [Nemania sp. FL0031]
MTLAKSRNNTPMDEEAPSPTRQHYSDEEFDSMPAEPSEARDYSSTAEMTDDFEKEDVHTSVETDSDSIAGEKTDRYSRSDDGEQAYVDHTDLEEDELASHISDATPRVGDDDEGSSQHEGTDEDVFTDKSPRSSMGSYDAGSESGKGIDIDNMTTITRSPRISDISQYDKEEFIPTARGTPRPPFRTPSDVRAMQMSSPAGSVYGSPRSSRKHFPTGSRMGTPSASAQYSPKRRSTPPRFKSRQEAPLVLLHVTLLPLRWMWGDLVNNLDPAEMSDQAKTLRSSWRLLQDRVGDTVVERGILLGHPQNDYEVLEERLLEALDLPVHRRARILECGHYLGPSNEATITATEDEESEDDYSQDRRQSAAKSVTKRHWCGTCKSEIRYDSLGEVKVFRVKVYASNGLMRAGAWEACWKEMERVDVELEPIVEPAVQDEIVRLAAAQQEREISQQEEADIAKEVETQFEEQRQTEERHKQQSRAGMRSSSPQEPDVAPEAARESRPESRTSRRRQRDEGRQRGVYGQTSPGSESRAREPSAHRYRDSHMPPSSQSPPQEENKRRESRRREYQSASFSELLFQSARVLMQDRKNVIIVTLSLFVLILSLRSSPPEPYYEPIIHRQKPMPEMHPVVEVLPVVQEHQSPVEAPIMEPMGAMPSFEASYDEPSEPSSIYQEALPSYEASYSESSEPSLEASSSIDQPPVASVEAEAESVEETVPEAVSTSTIRNPCRNPVNGPPSAISQASAAVSEGCPTVQGSVQDAAEECVQETVQEIVQEIETTTEKKVVKIIQTITQTQTQTQTEIQTEVEMATAVETVIVKATGVPQLENSSDVEGRALDSQDDAAPTKDEALSTEPAEDVPVAESAAEAVPESTPESTSESIPECELESVAEPVAEPEEACAEV